MVFSLWEVQDYIINHSTKDPEGYRVWGLGLGVWGLGPPGLGFRV